MTGGRHIDTTTTRRGLLAGVFGSALLVACGDSDDDTSSTPSSSPTSQAAAAPVKLLPGTPSELGAPAVPAATKSAAAAPVTAASMLDPYKNFGTATPGTFPRTIKHAMGEFVLNTAPTRIVTMDTAELDAMAALGIKPVGATDYGAGGLPTYLSGALDGTKNLGASPMPALEAIAALAPQLILSSKFCHEKLFPTISAMAPTLFIERPGYAFKNAFALYA